jgi:phosphonate ABC transporter permease subunit PhnE
MLNSPHKSRADWFLILAGIPLVLYYLLVYRPLSQESDNLDRSIRDLAEKVGGTNDTPRAGEPLNFSTITNRLETFQNALARLNAQRKNVQQRVTLGQEFQAKLREPFQLIDFLSERQQRTNRLAQLAQDQQVDLAPAALTAFPLYTGESRQPSLLWAQLAVLNRLLTAAITALGTAVLIYGVGSLLNWLYTFDNPQDWTLIPAVIGGSVAGVLALLVAPKRPFPIGFAIYTLTRGTLNILRSIEPIILGIIFVVWVGIGPFAGILALTLHSIADLGKLFSEQVENIDEGPLEAVTATGANRLQTIAFAVIPQIVPHYIAFIFYRWDINVRMSTIIGFVGGGGIGLVLQRSANLTQYRQASVMVIAIAVTVTSLDYISSQIRSRII